MPSAWGVLVTLLALGAGPTPKDRLWTRADEDAKTEAKRRYDAGAYDQAIPFYDAVLERHPRDQDSRRDRGACYLRMNQPERALADFDALVGYNPGWPGGWTNRGNALLMLGRPELALETFQTAVAAYQSPYWARMYTNIPTRQAAPAYAGLGEAFFQLGRLDLSLQAYAMVLNLDPGNPVGAQGRSRALLAMGKPAEALPDANAAVLANPNALGSWRNRGSDLAAMGRNEEALADFNQALLRDPSNALTWKSRGGLLVRMGRFDEALRDLNEAIRLDPNLASAYQNRGAAYNCLRQYDKAAKDLETAVKLDPDNVGAHNNLGLSLSALGSPDQAVIEFSEAIRLGAANASVFLNRALAYERLGVVDASARDFTEAMRHDPQSTLAKEGLERLHKAELAQNSPQAGSPMAMPLPGPTFEGVMHLAQALLASGDPQGAIRSLSEAIRIDPHRAEPYEMRAQALLMVGEDGAGQDARTFLKQSRWASPSSAEVAILGILADRREGRLNDAQVLLDEALANTAPDRWPHPALMYLRGQIDPAGLLEKAISQTQKAEAQALIGLSLGMAGDRQGAIEPLRQAIALGPNDSSSKIVEVARAALAQIE